MAASAADVPLLIKSENSSSERRISPAWTVAQLKARLEPITGVPASCQRLSLHVASQPPQPIEPANEETTQIAAWPLQAYAELLVRKLEPACLITSPITFCNIAAEPLSWYPLQPSPHRPLEFAGGMTSYNKGRNIMHCSVLSPWLQSIDRLGTYHSQDSCADRSC